MPQELTNAILNLSEGNLDLREYARTKQEENNIGNLLFPNVKTNDLKIEYIVGGNQQPVTAEVYSPDTNTKLSGRPGLAKNILDMLLIKDSKYITEDEIVKLQNPRTTAEEQEVLNKIFNDVDLTIESVYKRINMMRFEILQTGKLTLDENGVKGVIDYHMPEAHQETLKTAARWSEATANPLENLDKWVDTIVNDTGINPTRMLMDKATSRLLLNSEAVRKGIYGVNASIVPSLTNLNDFLTQRDLPTIAVYNEKYRLADGTVTPLIKPNTVILMPETKLGNTNFGLTAEEVELPAVSNLEVRNQDFITSVIYRRVDPVARITKSVARAIPSFEACNQVFVATVK